MAKYNYLLGRLDIRPHLFRRSIDLLFTSFVNILLAQKRKKKPASTQSHLPIHFASTCLKINPPHDTVQRISSKKDSFKHKEKRSVKKRKFLCMRVTAYSLLELTLN